MWPSVRAGRVQACDPGGPAEVVEGVLRALGVARCTLVGYDWGAGVALALAASAKHRRLVEAAVCMHPAFAREKVREPVSTLTCDS